MSRCASKGERRWRKLTLTPLRFLSVGRILSRKVYSCEALYQTEAYFSLVGDCCSSFVEQEK